MEATAAANDDDLLNETLTSFSLSFLNPSKQDALAAEESKADARKRKRIGEIDLSGVLI